MENSLTIESEDDKTDSVTLDSDAESSLGKNLLTIDEKLSEINVLNLNAAEKAVHYREKAVATISTSQETLNVSLSFDIKINNFNIKCFTCYINFIIEK
ncbi:hypothetical protein BpHYR1_031028 [Brachionus plicatilis]|uniref:Uncharacterized protein n=1 Tax=Brachionus plicatilis TaxID=10195 RepID=A0A3M7PIV8_BRAPC|nr:hypothetical protein BpHYR1_031028 [Brachionus plicatilis]